MREREKEKEGEKGREGRREGRTERERKDRDKERREWVERWSGLLHEVLNMDTPKWCKNGSCDFVSFFLNFHQCSFGHDLQRTRHCWYVPV